MIIIFLKKQGNSLHSFLFFKMMIANCLLRFGNLKKLIKSGRYNDYGEHLTAFSR